MRRCSRRKIGAEGVKQLPGADSSAGNQSITEAPCKVFAKAAIFLAGNYGLLRSQAMPISRQREGNWPRADRQPRSTFAVNDSALGQIVWRQFDSNPVTGNDADEVLAHTTGHVCQYDVSTFDFDSKSSISESLRDDALHFECFFLLFCHKKSVQPLSRDNPLGNRIRIARRLCNWPNPIILALAWRIGLARMGE